MRFSGRTAIVSGGARGIGAATATRLREEGADIAIVDVLRENGERTAREVGRWGGSGARRTSQPPSRSWPPTTPPM
jgi:NAD(P)-dependent dehydrogenase (short-subunit alcohol dehydrogenase family)